MQWGGVKEPILDLAPRNGRAALNDTFFPSKEDLKQLIQDTKT